MSAPPSQDDVPQTFRRLVCGLLIVAALASIPLGADPGQRGFVLMIVPLLLGASFFGRVFAIPAAAGIIVVLHGDLVQAAAVAGTVVIVGERTQQLRSRLGRFAERSFTDRLTGLFNYSFLQAQVRYEVDRVKRYGGSCALIVLDLDHFKRFNDTHGHQAGNLLLSAVADTLRAEKRDSDIAARFGGEEFVVLMPGESADAMRFAERLRQRVSELELQQLGPDGRVTVSLGIASFPEQAQSAAELFEHADQALYVAKGTGRDRVIVYPNVQVKRRTAKSA